MKAVYLDSFAGISGNMLLGAFLQAGVPLEVLEKELRKVPLPEEYSIHVSNVRKNGISAAYVEVDDMPCTEKSPRHEYDRCHGHEHRSWADIRKLIEASDLTDRVKAKSLDIFGQLAKAEGKVHGKPEEEITFHEVGAVDSIVDIVGSVICLEYLEVEKVMVSRINTGSGFVRCAHGLIPVPAPATAELLKGFPIYHQGAERELTTPTGAAFVKALASYEENMPKGFSTEAIAYGAGTWDLEIPNVLRVYLGRLEK